MHIFWVYYVLTLVAIGLTFVIVLGITTRMREHDIRFFSPPRPLKEMIEEDP